MGEEPVNPGEEGAGADINDFSRYDTTANRLVNGEPSDQLGEDVGTKDWSGSVSPLTGGSPAPYRSIDKPMRTGDNNR